MATVRGSIQRVSREWIAVWLIGLLCGAALATGIAALRSSADASVGGRAAPVSRPERSVVGGRLGGLTSDDTVNDAAIRQRLATSGNLELPPLNELREAQRAANGAMPRAEQWYQDQAARHDADLDLPPLGELRSARGGTTLGLPRAEQWYRAARPAVVAGHPQ